MPGGRLLESQVWYQQTDTEGLIGDDRAFGFGVSMPNSTGWRGGFSSRQVEQNFYPAVGFIDRAGIRDYALDFGFQRRFSDRWLRSRYLGFDGYRVERLDTGHVESQVAGLRYTMHNNTQDNLFMRLPSRTRKCCWRISRSTRRRTDRIRSSSRRVTTQFTDARIGIDSGDQRRVALRASLPAASSTTAIALQHEHGSDMAPLGALPLRVRLSGQ